MGRGYLMQSRLKKAKVLLNAYNDSSNKRRKASGYLSVDELQKNSEYKKIQENFEKKAKEFLKNRGINLSKEQKEFLSLAEGKGFELVLPAEHRGEFNDMRSKEFSDKRDVLLEQIKQNSKVQTQQKEAAPVQTAKAEPQTRGKGTAAMLKAMSGRAQTTNKSRKPSTRQNTNTNAVQQTVQNTTKRSPFKPAKSGGR